MAHAVSIRTVWDRQAIAALKTDPEVEAYIESASQGLASALRSAAPKLTGAGAASIAVRPSRAQGARQVGWDKEHYYMTYQDFYSTFDNHTNPNFGFAQETLERYVHT